MLILFVPLVGLSLAMKLFWGFFALQSPLGPRNQNAEGMCIYLFLCFQQEEAKRLEREAKKKAQEAAKVS